MREKIDLSEAVRRVQDGRKCSWKEAEKLVSDAFNSGKLSFEATNEEGRLVRVKMVDGIFTEQLIPQ